MTVRRSLTFISLVLPAACSGGDCAERQVRAVIEQMEQTAENRDVRELARHLSKDYRDTHPSNEWDLAAELHTFKIALRREGDRWQVSFLEVTRE